MSVFRVKYYRTGKARGARGFISLHGRSYEDVLINQAFDDLCQSVYQHTDRYVFLDNFAFVKRIRANSKLCIYQVMLFDWRDKTKLLAEYQVEIECEINDGLTDIFEQDCEFAPVPEKTMSKPLKEKSPTTWLMQEPRAVRWFLIELYYSKSLKALKETRSKATYHRNLKICQEKGYIVRNKLVKRIFVNKTVDREVEHKSRKRKVIIF